MKNSSDGELLTKLHFFLLHPLRSVHYIQYCDSITLAIMPCGLDFKTSPRIVCQIRRGKRSHICVRYWWTPYMLFTSLFAVFSSNSYFIIKLTDQSHLRLHFCVCTLKWIKISENYLFFSLQIINWPIADSWRMTWAYRSNKKNHNEIELKCILTLLANLIVVFTFLCLSLFIQQQFCSECSSMSPSAWAHVR